MEPKRRLQAIHVNFISLVHKGANKKVIIWKAAAPDENPNLNKVIHISKVDEDERIVYGIVYAPEEIDTEGDIAAEDVIKEAAYEFMRLTKTDQVDKQHDEEPDEGFVAESWIVKDGDPLFDEVGAWAVGIKVTNDKTWEAVKKGDISGLSMGGTALAEELNKGEIMKLSPEQEKSLAKRVWEHIQKGWAELKIVADVPTDPGSVQSVRDQIESVFKEQETFKEVDSAEKAGPILRVLDDVGGVFAEVGRSMLKEYIPDPPADDPPPTDDPPPAEDQNVEKIAKSVAGMLSEDLKEIKTNVADLDKRLKGIEDMPIGSLQLSPDTENGEPIRKDGKRIRPVRFVNSQ